MIGFYIILFGLILVSTIVAVLAVLSYLKDGLDRFSYWNKEELRMMSYTETRQKRLR